MSAKGGDRAADQAVGRRAFLRTAGLAGAGWLTLGDIECARAEAPAAGRRQTAVIQVWLGGAASHIETYDPKPQAPSEFRGPFGTIRTRVAGIQICETLPRHARMMDKVALVRSVHHDNSDHQHGMHWCLTGHFSTVNPFQASSHPSSGSVVARVRGAIRPGMPPYVLIGYPLDLVPGRLLPHQAAHLGATFDPFHILDERTGDGKDPGLDRDFRVGHLELVAGLSSDRLAERRRLLGRLDRVRRAVDAGGMMEAMDYFDQTALEMLTGPRARAAFDLDQEDPKVRDCYGRNRSGQTMLLARRLVEAGITFVTVIDPGIGLSSSGWDLHTQLEAGMKAACPRMDAAVSALVEDLYSRGLDRDVLVVVWGEFGRTPRINKDGGRDHWANVQSVLLAGGGFRMGQVIGSSTAKGEVPQDRPLWPYDVVATMYHHLGIDRQLTFANHSGRPIPVLAEGEVIRELL